MDEQFKEVYHLLPVSKNREHCLAVKELYCHKEWLVLESSILFQPGHFSSVIGPHTPSSLLPKCQALPSLHSDPEACTYVPFVGKRPLTEALTAFYFLNTVGRI